jgi:hypothetical protein
METNMTRFTLAIATTAAGLALGAPLAQAAPVAFDNGLTQITTPSGIETVRWVCGPYRCHWEPRRFYYYPPRPRRYWRRW